jgi:hypothetical protein
MPLAVIAEKKLNNYIIPVYDTLRQSHNRMDAASFSSKQISEYHTDRKVDKGIFTARITC